MNVPWDREETARQFVELYRVPYLVGRDASGSISTLYAVDATPITVLIDRSGRVAERIVGAMEAADLARRIERLVRESRVSETR